MAIRYYKRNEQVSKYGGEAPNATFSAIGETPADTPDWYTDSDTLHPYAYVGLRRGYLEYADRGDDPSAMSHNRYLRKDDQQELFHQHTSKIENASSDANLRGRPAMNLMGMARAEAFRVGHGFTYSDDLSAHSSALAKMGLDFGLISPNSANPEAEQRNIIASSGAHRHSQLAPSYFLEKHSPLGEEVDPEELKAGKKEVLNFITKRRAVKALGEQFDAHVNDAQPEQLHLSDELAEMHRQGDYKVNKPYEKYIFKRIFSRNT